jgi:uncharacterized damage-inducible protein DinB
MNYKTHFLNLLRYDIWANSKVVHFFKKNNISDGKPVELISHIMNAEIRWLERIKKSTEIPEPFMLRSIEEIPGLIESVNSQWVEFINSMEENDFNNLVDYRNNKGELWQTSIGDIITHIINHSTYHRAQIASLMRQMDIKPPATDYILYTRMNV